MKEKMIGGKINFDDLFNDFKVILSDTEKHGIVEGSVEKVKKALENRKSLKGAFLDISVKTEEQERIDYIKGIIDQLSENLSEDVNFIWRAEKKDNVKSTRIECIFAE